MGFNSVYDIVLDRINRAIPIAGLIFLYFYWKKEEAKEKIEDIAYCELMQSMGAEHRFPHASVIRFRYKMVGKVIAHLLSIATFSIFLFFLSWYYSLLSGIATGLVFEFLLEKIAEKIYDFQQPSCDEIVNTINSKDIEEI